MRVPQHPLLSGDKWTQQVSCPAAGSRKRPSYTAPSSGGSLDSPLSPDPPTEARVTLSFLYYSSVPETKKGNPLLLKIHLKLSSPLPQRID